MGTAVALDGTRSTGDGTLSCTWSFENVDGSIIWETITGCKLVKTFTTADTKYVKLIVKDADGDTASNKQSFPVSPTPTPSPTRTPTATPTQTPTPTPTPPPADTTPPYTSLFSGPSGTTQRGPVSFSFSATESGSTFQCRMDGPGSLTGVYQSCASPATYTSLADGWYMFYVRAIDAAGNIDPTPATRMFTIVAPAGTVWVPNVPVMTSPSNYSWNNTGTVTAAGTAEPGSTVEVFDSGTSLGTTVASAAGTWSRQLKLADGMYLLSAKATNLGGTSGASPAVVVTVDSTAPGPPVFVSPAAGSSVATSFTITGTGESGSTVELFEDGVSCGTMAVVSGSWSRQMTGVAVGWHDYTTRAIDFAGNVSSLSAARWIRVAG